MNRRRFLAQSLLAAPLASMAGAKEEMAQAPPAPQPPAQKGLEPAPEQAPAPAPVPPKPWSIPIDAVAMALQDAVSVQTALPFVRWIWVQSGAKEDYQALCDTLAKVTRNAPADTRPVLVGGILARVDLRAYYPSVVDVSEVLGLWEQLRFDPKLSYILTKDTLRLLTVEQRQIKIRRSKIEWDWVRDPKDDTKGKWVAKGRKVELTPVGELKDFVAERVNNGNVEAAGYSKLQAATLSEAPIVSADYFVSRVLDTIKDQKDGKDTVFSLVYGGLYYEFRGIRKVDKKLLGDKATDLDQLLFDLGIGAKGETYKQTFDRLQSDQAAVLYRRRVNGKKCRIRWFPSLAARPTGSQSVVFITEDLRDQDIDLGNDPVANLVNAEVAAYEVIFVGANGQLGYALYNGAGARLDEAAPDVATDRLVPSPHGTRLRSAISCIRCHSIEGDGWQEFKNDALVLLANRFAVFGDLTDADQAIFETLGRLKGQYSGDPQFLLNDLRKHHARAVLQATGKWDKSAGGRQLDVASLSAARISAMFARERYDPVSPAVALQQLGAPVAEKPLEALQALIPKESAPLVNGIRREDPRIMGLLAGLSINAYDFALSYSFMLDRAQLMRKALVR